MNVYNCGYFLLQPCNYLLNDGQSFIVSNTNPCELVGSVFRIAIN